MTTYIVYSVLRCVYCSLLLVGLSTPHIDDMSIPLGYVHYLALL